MAYFRCTTGGSGKGNTLVVTCADDLAGATITCTDGTKTYNKTCPSTAPYEVTFYGLMAGTWTVSATVSGNTYTTTVVVVDCAALLGGFSWRTWVDTAQYLDSSDYNSLDEVLADEEAVRELCLEHNCVDYLADITTASEDVETIINNDLFAKWVNNSDYALDFLGANVVIKALMDEADKYFYGEWVIVDDTTTPPTWGPKGNVPVMTSNTAPYGEASATSQYNTDNAPYKAFDGSDSTTWASSSNTNQRLIYRFTNPVNVRLVEFVNRLITQTQIIKDYKIQYSDDGSTWYDAVDETLTNQQVEVTTTNISDKGYHLYWGLLAINNYGSTNISVISLQFYGRELSVSVPKMATDTTPYGVASASPATSSYPAWKAFDGDDTSFAVAETSASAHPSSIGYDFQNGTVVKFAMLYPRYQNASLFPKNYKIQGSNDGFVSDINTLYEGSTDNANKKYFVAINNAIAYKQYRVYDETSATYSGYTMQLFTLQFYGLDYSEKEFEEGVTKKWLYDHGLELETIENTALVGTLVKGADSMNLTNPSSGIGRISTSNAIDVTSYSLERMKIGKIATLYNGSYACTLALSGAKDTFSNKGYVDLSKALLPNNGGLDISSVNESVYPWIYTSNVAGTWEITELWLE